MEHITSSEEVIHKINIMFNVYKIMILFHAIICSFGKILLDRNINTVRKVTLECLLNYQDVNIPTPHHSALLIGKDWLNDTI